MKVADRSQAHGSAASCLCRNSAGGRIASALGLSKHRLWHFTLSSPHVHEIRRREKGFRKVPGALHRGIDVRNVVLERNTRESACKEVAATKIEKDDCGAEA